MMLPKPKVSSTTNLRSGPIALRVLAGVETTNLVVKGDGRITIDPAVRRRDESRHDRDVGMLVSRR